jgi:MFS family permease
MADRHGKKRFLVAGLLIYTAAGYTYTLAVSVEHLVIIRILHGVGSAMIIPIAMAYIGELSPEGQEGRYMAMLHISILAGIGGGPILGGVFLDLWGYASAFYAMSLFSLIAMSLVLVVLPKQQGRIAQKTAESLMSVFRRMLSSQRVMGILLARMSTMTIMIPTMAFLPILMSQHMNAGGIEVGIVVACRTLVNAAFQTPFGKLADRWHKNRLILIGSTLTGFGMLAVPFADSLTTLVILFALVGFGEAVSWPSIGALATEEGRIYGQGATMGVASMAMSAGLLVGSVGVGALMDLFGIDWAFYAVSLFLFLSSIAAVRMMGPEAQKVSVVSD